MQKVCFSPVPNPTLETILMIEKAAKKHSGECGKYQLWKKLPRKVMYQTYKAALNYLIDSKKIIIDKDQKITWIWNPKTVNLLLRKGLIETDFRIIYLKKLGRTRKQKTIPFNSILELRRRIEKN